MVDIAAGWYDDGSGRQRWWDGSTWTTHYLDEQPAQTTSGTVANTGGAVASWAKGQAQRLTAKHDLGADEDAVWSAVGKPLTGIGAGRYKLTAEYLIFETGTLSSKGQQIRVREIFDVDSSQTMAQKARGLGTITLRARRPSGDEKVVLQDIPNFREGVVAINRVSDEARHAHHLRENTSRSSVEYTGAVHAMAPTMVPAAAAPASAPGSDLNSELERLAGLRAQGIIDDEEFTAAKRKLLGL
ncbi:SHOCT domain-containing protein [Microbacterium sp. LWO14-1.2]|uniref:SHOCT domain-containing protein n=1 Tax=Microbacterium sp. LWO14-1.2 TaxID=3135263 RepID=UPI0031388525